VAAQFILQRFQFSDPAADHFMAGRPLALGLGRVGISKEQRKLVIGDSGSAVRRALLAPKRLQPRGADASAQAKTSQHEIDLRRLRPAI
jgi:hypothetical protein